MIRGLKDSHYFQALNLVHCFNLRPDDKGTERSPTVNKEIRLMLGFNLRPDDKGTERIGKRSRASIMLKFQPKTR